MSRPPAWCASTGGDTLPPVPRVLTRLVVVLVVLLVILIAADRVGVVLASRAVGQGLTTSERLTAPASVSFPDIPFLTQAAAGRYGTVDVTMEGLPTTAGVVIDRVDATLHGVSAPTSALLRGQVRSLAVDQGDAVAFVSFHNLELAGRQKLGNAVQNLVLGQATSGNRVALSASVRSLIGTVTVRGQVELAVTKGQVTVRLLPQTLTGIPVALRTQVANLVDLTALAPALPFGLRVSAVTVEPSGLRVHASGTTMTIPI